MNDIKIGDKKIFLTSFPSGVLMEVTILGFWKDNSKNIYIRKPSGGSDTTTSEWLFDLPQQLRSRV